MLNVTDFAPFLNQLAHDLNRFQADRLPSEQNLIYREFRSQAELGAALQYSGTDERVFEVIADNRPAERLTACFSEVKSELIAANIKGGNILVDGSPLPGFFRWHSDGRATLVPSRETSTHSVWSQAKPNPGEEKLAGASCAAKSCEIPRGAEKFPEVQRRVQARLKALGYPRLSPLAQQYDLGRDFIRDLVTNPPRKKSIGSNKIAQLVRALQCDAEYLTLAQLEPKRAQAREKSASTSLIPAEFVGFLEVGAWRVPKAEIALPREYDTVLALLKIDGKRQQVGIVRGSDMEDADIKNNMLVVAVPYDGSVLPDGKFVIVERRREELVELSVRVVRYLAGQAQLATAPERGEPEMVPITSVRIVGIITNTVKVF